ncbi:MAG: FAD-dependent oxidoreductase [Clostridiales bacterium]|nr:FAD-dependent oxidoreductase [Clostridiales bacterium]
MLKCSVNPVVGRELRVAKIQKPEKKKKVLVAGGGPSGMQAAISAAGQGHSVTLYEKSDKLGGALNFADHVPFKSDLKNYKELLERRVEAAGVKICRGTALTPEIARSEAPDAIIAAVGAIPIVPPIPGIDGKNVVLAANMYDDGVKIGNNVVVIGGGLVGVESALLLAMKGHHVTVLEMKDEIAEDASPGHRMPLMEQLEEKVALETCTRCVSISENGVLAETTDGEQKRFPADTVLVAAGSKALTEDAEALRSIAQDFWMTGDCRKPKKVLDAVRSGFDAGMDL